MDFMKVTAFKLSKGAATAWITAHVLLKFFVGVVSANFVVLVHHQGYGTLGCNIDISSWDDPSTFDELTYAW